LSGRRRGASAVELALLLPFLAVLFLAAVDLARLYYYYGIVTSCARNGALYGSDPVAAAESPYPTIQDAASADATDLSPAPTVSSANGVDGDGNPYVEVSVVYPLATFATYPGVPNPVILRRTVRMRVAPATPQ
jgi:Flp pilus assembly protein TadG